MQQASSAIDFTGLSALFFNCTLTCPSPFVVLQEYPPYQSAPLPYKVPFIKNIYPLV
jgi:hypothetical protein